jgi:hypothetical protein
VGLSVWILADFQGLFSGAGVSSLLLYLGLFSAFDLHQDCGVHPGVDGSVQNVFYCVIKKVTAKG